MLQDDFYPSGGDRGHYDFGLSTVGFGGTSPASPRALMVEIIDTVLREDNDWLAQFCCWKAVVGTQTTVL